MAKIRFVVDHVRYFFDSSYFDGRHKTKIHILQIVLVILMIGLTGGRIATIPSGRQVSRGDTLGIVMGIKTLVVITYQLVTSHVGRFRKWQSLKAYAVLNSLEVLFWFTVIIISLMGISSYCQGANCGLSWLVVLVATSLLVLAFWTAVVSISDHRHYRSTGTQRQSFTPKENQVDPAY
ncbi:hypothetical protein BKA67DRAFT_646380 [Truncatella angustata]|uniref:Uncharacterized protein n=1 Tax=Truncatella angustata TaxID=152316 RepID=A0A9P8UM47_9PEZI|nr:uncharacterized protein BKA67DRAFT_646380 [Truncatella angustata]KAH6654686.1 hypothetical protein BKA67DRAFT_646380 [Truncatella angustata]